MKIYHYHPEYKHFISDGFADPSPLDPPGTWLIPAFATNIEPPSCNAKEIQIFKDSSWSVIEDKRGIYYNIFNGEEFQNHNPLEIPENSTEIKPPKITENQKLSWSDGWIIENISPQPELTTEEKLKSVGITVEDLKNLLGL